MYLQNRLSIMSNRISYIVMILLHVLVRVVVYYLPFISKVLTVFLFFLFTSLIIKNKNKNNEALLFSTYIVASEVFFRMTSGVPNNEYGKYSVIIFLVIGIIYKGFSKKAFIYWIFILLLIPGVLIGIYSLLNDVSIRKALAFNISGPICLAISSIYTFDRNINFVFIEKILSAIIFPVVTTIIYMYLYTPTTRDVFIGTDSNFLASGGFGPNQVATLMGLGMFALFAKLILFSKNEIDIFSSLILLFFVTYRGIITFSRGGMYTGVIMIILLLFSLYYILNLKGRFKIILIVLFAFLSGLSVFVYSSYQTGGMIDKRYSGKDALGREKASKFSGRERLVDTELQMFYENPIAGVGVGVNKQYREELIGVRAASHNEVSRMLAEHGLFGIVGLLILFFRPLMLYFDKKENIFLLSFFVFWLLTINHAAMRLAAPAFIYSLSLLKVKMD